MKKELKLPTFLVTGSSGFVGSHLVKRIKEKGAQVITFDITERKNITKWSDFSDIPSVDIVYHLAAVTFVPLSQEKPRMTFEINIMGTANVLEFCRLNKARMVFASSYVYGNPNYLPVDEKHPLSPTNPYSKSKVFGELLCQVYSEDYGVPCIVLRPFNIFGEGQNISFLIPKIIHQIRTGGMITLNDLRPRRDLLYISDAIDAYLKAGEYDKSNFEVFNIGSGISHSVQEIAEKLIEISGRDIRMTSLNKKRNGEISETVADISKAKNLLNWRPKVTIDKGLSNVLTS